MDDENEEGPPKTFEEALVEFQEDRNLRIAKRRVRVAKKIAAAKGIEYVDKVVVSSSDLLDSDAGGSDLDEEEEEEEEEETAAGHEAHETHGTQIGDSDFDDDEEEEEEEQEVVVKISIEKQIEDKKKELEQIILDGDVLITNVLVAAEYREKERQHKQEETKKERLLRLRKEADECQVMYDDIAENWNMKAEKALPMELYQQMKGQQEACDELLAKKDELITFLRRQIFENDFEYETNLEMYQKDTMLMGDRIDDLVDDLRQAFLEELDLHERDASENRESILEEYQKEWMDLLETFDELEKKHVSDRKTDAIAKFHILRDLYVQTKQESREMRHKMEDDMRNLTQEREQIKYACHLNMEKMGYNLHILQCRSKENAHLKNMLKRLLLKLHDRMVAKAANLRKKMEMGRKHVEKLMKEMQRLESQVIGFGPKTYRRALSDHRKYIDLWESQEELAQEKLKRLVESDKFIYETELGMEYPITENKFDATELFFKVPSEEEIRRTKLDKIKYPTRPELSDYWEGLMTILNIKGKEVWDVVQECFQEYESVLKERNDCVMDVQRLYKQNFELSHLLRKYLQTASANAARRSYGGPWDSRNMNYC